MVYFMIQMFTCDFIFYFVIVLILFCYLRLQKESYSDFTNELQLIWKDLSKNNAKLNYFYLYIRYSYVAITHRVVVKVMRIININFK